MEDATKTKEGDGAQQVQEKRIPTLSEKRLAMQVEKCQKVRKAKSVQVGKHGKNKGAHEFCGKCQGSTIRAEQIK